jgi:DNA polymerase III delta subunit
VHLGRGAAAVLAERVGGFVREGDVDRRRQGQMAVRELEKLALYRPGAEVSADDVRELVPEAIPGSAWALLDAIAERRTRPAVTILDRLLESTPEPLLVTMLHRRLRELLEVVDRLGAGEPPGSLVRSMHLNPYRAKHLVEQAHAWTAGDLERALEGLLELDAAVKGADGRVATDAQRRAAFMLWIVEAIPAAR